VTAALSLSKIKTNGVKEKILIAINTIIDKLQDKIVIFKEKEKVVSFLASSMNEAA
jgi:ribosome-associated translation inhibitor RaiA